MKNSLGRFQGRLGRGGRIGDDEDRATGIIDSEKQEEIRKINTKWTNNTHFITGIPEGEERDKEAERILEAIVARNVSKLMRDMNINIKFNIN